jgi:hypothetical protein
MSPKKKQAPVEIECPECGSDNWQRVDVAYDLGTSDQSGTAVLAGGAGLNVGAMSGTSRTRFAQSIAPPPKRSAGRSALWSIVGFLAAFLGIAMMTMRSPVDADTFNLGPLILICGLLIVGIWIWKYFQADMFNKMVRPKLIEKWRRKFVCLKCGCVWIPDHLKPPENS